MFYISICDIIKKINQIFKGKCQWKEGSSVEFNFLFLINSNIFILTKWLECFLLLFFRAEASCQRIAELNPYVTVKTLAQELNDDTDLAYLAEFQVNLF